MDAKAALADRVRGALWGEQGRGGGAVRSHTHVHVAGECIILFCSHADRAGALIADALSMPVHW